MPIIKYHSNTKTRPDIRLTTIDNPFNPFVEWDEWNRFDEDKGYFTNNYLARIARTSDDMSDVEYSNAIDDAIEEIVKFNILGVYRKVTPEFFKNIDGGEGI